MVECTLDADNFIKENIYKNKVTIFGKKDCKFTSLSQNFFLQNYNYLPKSILIDEMEYSTMKFNKENLIVCLKKRTKRNIVPMIYINGMLIGNYAQLEEKAFLRDLDIFF